MTASVLKQDQKNIKGSKERYLLRQNRMRIFGANPFFQATKQHLNNS